MSGAVGTSVTPSAIGSAKKLRRNCIADLSGSSRLKLKSGVSVRKCSGFPSIVGVRGDGRQFRSFKISAHTRAPRERSEATERAMEFAKPANLWRSRLFESSRGCLFCGHLFEDQAQSKCWSSRRRCRGLTDHQTSCKSNEHLSAPLCTT